jgi:hypothetical protein
MCLPCLPTRALCQLRKSCLHSRGNLSVEASYKQIDEIWQQLELNYLELGIEDSSSD